MRKNPIRSIWLAQYLIVFSLALIFFLLQLTKAPEKMDNLLYALFFLLLIILFLFMKAKFSFSFEDEYIEIKQFWGNKKLLYQDIRKIFIRQPPIGKLFDIQSLIIQFDDPVAKEKVQIEAFGKSLMTTVVDLPGTYGDLFTIPGLSAHDAERIKNSLLAFSKQKPEVTSLGAGYPYYTRLTTFSYIITLILVIVTILFLITSSISLILLPP